MRIFKLSIKIILGSIILSTFSCGDSQYPNLEDGLYAEFVTNSGTMVAKLHHIKTPVTVANFIALAEGVHPLVSEEFVGKPFYNGTIFHRVMDKFMIQGGCPDGNGRGTPGYYFEDEFDENLRHYKPGILSMANPGPNSNGSQFFIMEVPYPSLDNKHTVFGELVSGIEVQDSISNVPVAEGTYKPLNDVILQEVNIIRIGSEARNYDASKTWEIELALLQEDIKTKNEEARKLYDENQRILDEKTAAGSAEISPILEEYKGKASTLPSGLISYTIENGTGPSLKEGDKASVLYAGYFTDGKLFDSNIAEVEEKFGKYNINKEERGMYGAQPMFISPDAHIIPGFKEALMTMKVGEKKYIYVPSELAYGSRGRGSIRADTDLCFIIEIIGIED